MHELKREATRGSGVVKLGIGRLGAWLMVQEEAGPHAIGISGLEVPTAACEATARAVAARVSIVVTARQLGKLSKWARRRIVDVGAEFSGGEIEQVDPPGVLIVDIQFRAVQRSGHLQRRRHAGRAKQPFTLVQNLEERKLRHVQEDLGCGCAQAGRKAERDVASCGSG